MRASTYLSGQRKVAAGGGGVAFRSASQVIGTTDSVTPTRPSGNVSGDLLIMVAIEFDSVGPGDTGGLGTPSGWTVLASASPGFASASGSSSIATWRRVADGTATDIPTITDFNGSGTTSAAITLVQIAITGANATPIDAQALNFGSNLTAQLAPTVTATTSSGLLICGWATQQGTPAAGKSYTTPGSMTSRASGQVASGPRGYFNIATEALVASGATGTRSATATTCGASDNYGVFSIIVK